MQWRFLIAVGLSCITSGCGTDNLHKSAVAFSDAASATLTAETALAERTNAIETAEFRSRARLWYLDDPRHPSKALSKPTNWMPDYLPDYAGSISAKALGDRVACLKAVQAYAEALATLTSGTNTTTVDKTTTDLFGSLANAIKTGGGSLSASSKGTAATAVDELGRAVIDAATTREVVTAAKRARQPLAAIAQALSSEAVLESADEKNKLQSLSESQGLALYRAWHDPSVSTEGRFDIWERLMSERDLQGVTISEQEINRSLADLVKANDALAAGDRVSFGELARTAQAEAEHAINFYQAATK